VTAAPLPVGEARAASAHVVVADLDAPVVVLDEEDAHHLGSVLRLRPGEPVSVTDGRGGWRLCEYAGPGVPGRVQPVGDIVRPARPTPLVTVAFAPVKGDRPEWAVQKLTELGVDRVVLLRTDRSVVRWDDRRAAGHLERLRRVARQALMQSRGLWLPEVSGVSDVAVVAGWPGAALAAPGGPGPDLAHPVVLVGPEGGWSPEEEAGLDVPRVGLAPGVLRTESAAVAAGALLVALRAGLVGPRSG
jgi:16S rRNA (uracil1498-N3)-methyltransferase